MKFESAGYDDLRTAIVDRWTHLALVDSNGNEATRIDIPADGRASWVTTSGNPYTLSVTVTGGDSDISTPVTIVRGELYTSGTATSRVAYDAVGSPQPTLEASKDELTVTLDAELPDI